MNFDKNLQVGCVSNMPILITRLLTMAEIKQELTMAFFYGFHQSTPI